MEQVHGHEIMRMILASDKAFNKSTLIDEIISTFGKGTLFYTCSASHLSAEDIVDFLDKRGKLIHHGDTIETSENLICNH